MHRFLIGIEHLHQDVRRLHPATADLTTPMQPEEGVIDLYLPDFPGVEATLEVELVGDLQVVEFGGKLPGVCIVGLIFRCSSQKDL